MEITKNYNIKECYQRCPFFGSTKDGMECNHPYWKDKGAYDNMIITQDNSRGKVPEKCPLRKESLEITSRYQLEGNMNRMEEKIKTFKDYTKK